MRMTPEATSSRAGVRFFGLMGAVVSFLFVCPSLDAQKKPDASYWLYVAAESDDEVALVRFDAAGARVEKTIPVGVWPTEIEGPHGLRVSPEGDFWYLSLAHGKPYGSVYKYRTGTDNLVGSVGVGMFPASMDIAASTGLLYVVNFDLHGGMKPSTISVVDTVTMTEVVDVEVGIMPHGSRLNRMGNRQYSVMMMTDELVEIDAFRFEVLRRLSLTTEAAPDTVPTRAPMAIAETRSQEGMAAAVDRPTWVHPGPQGRFLYVACNGSDQVKVVDLERWEVVDTLNTGAGPYNVDVTADGRLLVVTHKTAGSTGIWDLQEGVELARLDNSRGVTHGVVISPDANYAFVSVEGVAGEPGALDVIDLDTLELVATVEVGRQASGITFWKIQ